MGAISSFLSAIDVYTKNLKSIILYTLLFVGFEALLYVALLSIIAVFTIFSFSLATISSVLLILLLFFLILALILSVSGNTSYIKSLYELYASNKKISSSSAKEFFLNILKFFKKSALLALLFFLGIFLITLFLVLSVLIVGNSNISLLDLTQLFLSLNGLLLFLLALLLLFIYFYFISFASFSFISLAIKNLGVIDTLKDAFSFMSRRFISVISLFILFTLISFVLAYLLQTIVIIINLFIFYPILQLSYIILYAEDMEKLK